jgi:predicted RNase H-like HicB family nuclease
MVVGREFEVILEEQDDGGFVASVPDLPGVWTQAETRDEAIDMVKDAIAGHLETLEELGRPLPKPRREHLTVQA